MKKFQTKKALMGALSIMLAFGTFAGCKAPTSGNNSSGGNSTSSSTNSTPNTIGKFEPLELTSNGEDLSDYEIIISAEAGASIQYAAEILQSNVLKVTEVEIPILTDDSLEGENEIIIGNTNRSECEEFDFEALGEEAYQVKSVGKDLVIAGGDRGTIYGVYDYLETLGYRFFAPGVSTTPRAKAVFVAEDADLSWDPIFNHRDLSWYGTRTTMEETEWAVSQRVNSDFARTYLRDDEKFGGYSGLIGGNRYMVHTADKFLPKAVYFKDHPEYFSETGANPCWTNQEAMDIIYTEVLRLIDLDNKSNIISISMNDSGEYCKCASCQAQYDEYGVSETYYRAINNIAKKLQTDRPGILVDTLSYAFATEAPRTDIKFEDNLMITLCLTMCRYHTDPEECHQLGFLYADPTAKISSLKTEQERLLGWDGHCDNLKVWWYAINWGMLLSSDPSYEATRNNFRFFAENNVTGMYCEGYSRESGEFSELKAYLTAKLMINPLMSKEEYYYHMDEFLQGYYGEEAGEYIREYIDTTYNVIMQEMPKTGHLKHWFALDDNFNFDYDPETKKFAPFIKQFNNLWAKAEEAAEGNGAQLARVRKSKIHWDYLELYNTFDRKFQNADADEKLELVERNRDLYNRIKTAGITQRFDNDTKLKNISDFSITPAMWW